MPYGLGLLWEKNAGLIFFGNDIALHIYSLRDLWFCVAYCCSTVGLYSLCHVFSWKFKLLIYQVYTDSNTFKTHV